MSGSGTARVNIIQGGSNAMIRHRKPTSSSPFGEWLLIPNSPMKIRFLALLVILCAGASAAFSSGGREWLTSVAEARDQATSADQLILVDLYADWCGWCKKLEKEVFSTPEFQEFTKEMVLLRVDTEDGAEGSQLQDKYGAYSLPTTLILDPKMVKIGAVRGYAPTAQYLERMQSELRSFDELVAGYDRFSSSTDPQVLAVLAEEFHRRGEGERSANAYRRILELDQLTPKQQNWTRYQLVDALRLAGDYDAAMKELSMARQGTVQTADQELLERLDYLAADIALDRGDCQQARAALESFLGQHPASDLRRQAKRALATLDSDGFSCT